MNVRKNENDKRFTEPLVKKTWVFDFKDIINDYQALHKHSIVSENFGTKEKTQYLKAKIIEEIDDYIMKGNLAIITNEVDRHLMSEKELKDGLWEALNWYDQALIMAGKYNLVESQCEIIIQVAKAYKKAGNNIIAEEYFAKAFELAPEYYVKNTSLLDLPIKEYKATIQPV